MSQSASDANWLDAAARLAARARPLSRPNPGVGCILIGGNVVVGRGWTASGGRPHAEAIALEQAGKRAHGATAYVTLEPCAHRSARGPSCADLLAEAGLARVVAGAADPDPRTLGQGIARLCKAGVAAEIAENTACRASLAGYLMKAEHGRPHVTLKLAMSLDGCIAMADGESRWITGETARAHAHSRRAMADAILVGGGTWRTDAPGLDVRLAGLESRSPARFVLTSHKLTGAQALSAPADIARMEGVHYLYVEGGAQTAAGFLAEDLVDRLEIYRAPVVIGAGKRALEGFAPCSLAEAHGRWALAERRQLGSDSFEAYQRSR